MTSDDEQHEHEIQQALEEVKSENPRVRSAAVERLGKLGVGLSALQIVTTDRNGYVRAAAAEALAQFPSEEVALFLGDLLFDSNPFVRSAAIRSLGRVGATDYVPNLVDALEDENPHIRAAALRALSDMRAAEAAEMLVESLRDPHRKIRLDAARGLRQIAAPETNPAMQQVLREALHHPRPDLPFLNTLIQAIANSGTTEEVGPLLVMPDAGNGGLPDGGRARDSYLSLRARAPHAGARPDRPQPESPPGGATGAGRDRGCKVAARRCASCWKMRTTACSGPRAVP